MSPGRVHLRSPTRPDDAACGFSIHARTLTDDIHEVTCGHCRKLINDLTATPGFVPPPGVDVGLSEPWVIATPEDDVVVLYNVRRTPDSEAAARAIAATIHQAADYGPLFILIDQQRGSVYSFHRSMIDVALMEPG